MTLTENWKIKLREVVCENRCEGEGAAEPRIFSFFANEVPKKEVGKSAIFRSSSCSKREDEEIAPDILCCSMVHFPDIIR